MIGWILVVSGLAMAAYAALVGVVSWEVTLALIVAGLADAAIGVFFILRDRRDRT